MKTTKTKFPYVYRAIYPNESVDGYMAKVIRKNGSLQRFFQLRSFNGDHEKCMAAANAAVKAFLQNHPKLTRVQVAEIPRPKKDADLPMGVRRVTNVVKGKPYDFFEAEWSPRPNEQKKKRFSVNLYGEDEALDLAIKARTNGLAEMAANESD